MEKKKCTAVVLAAGAGKRMNSAVAKQYLLLDGKPVLWYALQTFQQSDMIDDIILVVGKGEISFCTEEVVQKYGFDKVSAVVEGGAERYLSVEQALHVITERNAEALGNGTSQYVFIHDGARPFVTEEMIQATYQAVCRHGACVAAVPVKDTIKIADEQEFAARTPKRKLVWAVQTPQVFETELICEAYRRLRKTLKAEQTSVGGNAAGGQKVPSGLEITDDAMVVETMMNHPVKLVKASYENIKITTPEDMLIAESLLKKKREA